MISARPVWQVGFTGVGLGVGVGVDDGVGLGVGVGTSVPVGAAAVTSVGCGVFVAACSAAAAACGVTEGCGTELVGAGASVIWRAVTAMAVGADCPRFAMTNKPATTSVIAPIIATMVRRLLLDARMGVVTCSGGGITVVRC